jgi:hypothetical protein
MVQRWAADGLDLKKAFKGGAAEIQIYLVGVVFGPVPEWS